MAETPDEIVRRLQAQVESERKAAIEVHWIDPGPYRLPRCTGQQGAMIVDPHTVELQLETEKGQRVLIPIDPAVVGPLATLFSILAKRIQGGG